MTRRQPLVPVRGEIIKLATLPATWVASAIAVLAPLALTILNSRTVRTALETGNEGDLVSTSTVDSWLEDLAIGVMGPIILGVVAISSEYTRADASLGSGRQIATTMAAAPRRSRLMTAKLTTLVSWIAGLAAVAIPATVIACQQVLGPWASGLDDILLRGAGVGAYWIVMGLLAFALAAAARSDVVPLALLLVNASIVPLSFLISRVTSAARFMPDLAWMAVSLRDDELPIDPVAPAAAWAALGCWALAATAASFLCYSRRDA